MVIQLNNWNLSRKYYDETSTSVNPVMLAKVKGQDGNIHEIKIAVNEVDPSNASYVEMIALSAHLKTEGKIDGPAGAFATMVFHSRVKEANNNSIYEKIFLLCNKHFNHKYIEFRT